MKAARVEKLKKLDGYMVEYRSLKRKFAKPINMAFPEPDRIKELAGLIQNLMEDLYS